LPHHRSEPAIVNTKHPGPNVGSDSLSPSSSYNTIVDDRSDGNASRLFEHAIKGVREQGKEIERTFPKK
jgi:hypothetical protein